MASTFAQVWTMCKSTCPAFELSSGIKHVGSEAPFRGVSTDGFPSRPNPGSASVGDTSSSFTCDTLDMWDVWGMTSTLILEKWQCVCQALRLYTNDIQHGMLWCGQLEKVGAWGALPNLWQEDTSPSCSRCITLILASSRVKAGPITTLQHQRSISWDMPYAHACHNPCERSKELVHDMGWTKHTMHTCLNIFEYVIICLPFEDILRKLVWAESISRTKEAVNPGLGNRDKQCIKQFCQTKKISGSNISYKWIQHPSIFFWTVSTFYCMFGYSEVMTNSEAS